MESFDETDYEVNLLFWKLKVALVGLQVIQIASVLKKRASQRRRRPVGRLWTLPYCSRGMFAQFSDYNLVKEAALNDGVTFFNQMRMSPTNFEKIAQYLGHLHWYEKKDTRMRKCIPLGKVFLNQNT